MGRKIPGSPVKLFCLQNILSNVSLFLVNADIIDFKARGELGWGGVAPAGAMDGKDDENVVRLAERIANTITGRIGRVVNLDGVQQVIVDIDPDLLLVPIHMPDMKVFRPVGISEAVDRRYCAAFSRFKWFAG